LEFQAGNQSLKPQYFNVIIPFYGLDISPQTLLLRQQYKISLKLELIIRKIHMSTMRTTFSYSCSGGILHESYTISEGVELFLVQSVVSTFSLIML
jgi:hypothetical protein